MAAGLFGPTLRILRSWKLNEPVEVRQPEPPVLVQALIATFMPWKYHWFALEMWLGFHCRLAPADVFSLRREDNSFVNRIAGLSDLPNCAIVTILAAKSHKTCHRWQHVLCNDAFLLSLL